MEGGRDLYRRGVGLLARLDSRGIDLSMDVIGPAGNLTRRIMCDTLVSAWTLSTYQNINSASSYHMKSENTYFLTLKWLIYGLSFAIKTILLKLWPFRLFLQLSRYVLCRLI